MRGLAVPVHLDVGPALAGVKDVDERHRHGGWRRAFSDDVFAVSSTMKQVLGVMSAFR